MDDFALSASARCRPTASQPPLADRQVALFVEDPSLRAGLEALQAADNGMDPLRYCFIVSQVIGGWCRCVLIVWVRDPQSWRCMQTFKYALFYTSRPGQELRGPLMPHLLCRIPTPPHPTPHRLTLSIAPRPPPRAPPTVRPLTWRRVWGG